MSQMRKTALKAAYGLVGIVVSSIVTALVTGQPITGLTKLKGLFGIFIKGSVPAWAFAPVFCFALFGGWYFISRQFKQKTRLHFVQDAHNCGWAPESDSVMFVRVGGSLTYDGQGSLTLLKSFLAGTQPVTDMVAQTEAMDGSGKLKTVNRLDVPSNFSTRVLLNLRVKPRRGAPGKTYNSRLIFRDGYNRDHDAGPVELPYVGPPAD
jgi:hypothetical protein